MCRLSRSVRLVAVVLLALSPLAGCFGDLDSGDGGADDAGGGARDLAGGPAGDLSAAGGGDGDAGPGPGPGPGIDAAGPACTETPFSTFPSVAIHFVDPKCRFTLAQAAAGIDFNYELVVEKDVAGVVPAPGDAGGCGRPDGSGLILFERVTGAGQNWCRCDEGRCLPPPMDPISIVGGRYSYKLRWSGRNWSGPSDTNQPEGAPFPPGTYDVLVTASGQYAAGPMMLPFTVRDVLSITLVQ